jgi:hypothetical protein
MKREILCPCSDSDRKYLERVLATMDAEIQDTARETGATEEEVKKRYGEPGFWQWKAKRIKERET